ncbi:MAG: hypothetical protein HFH91_13715 [Lachnospiraceae bacterium]|jgi:hypothetical protein|nr:hypothetical protein [Lachnospiraceae bacterium]
MNKSESKYFSCFPQDTRDIWDKINGNELNELILITQDYLRPYLQFISDNRKVYRAAFRNPNNMQANIRYENLKQYNLEPILKKFGVPDKFQQYYIVYYIEGITAIIKEWLNHDCTDSVEVIATVIEECVRPSGGADG